MYYVSLSTPNRQQWQLKDCLELTTKHTQFFIWFFRVFFVVVVFVEHVHSLNGRWFFFSLSNVTAGSGIESKSIKCSKKFWSRWSLKRIPLMPTRNNSNIYCTVSYYVNYVIWMYPHSRTSNVSTFYHLSIHFFGLILILDFVGFFSLCYFSLSNVFCGVCMFFCCMQY